MALPKKKILVLILILAGVALLGFAFVRKDLIMQIISLVNDKTPTPLFLVLFFILPIFGFPISVFLVVLGIKFGPIGGILLMLAVMPVHMAISFLLAKVAGNFIQNLLSRWNYSIPQVPADKHLRFTFIVASIPVAPYTVKNFLLALAGIPFWLYLGMNWGCQAVLATPGVILGGSIADLDPRLFLAAIAGLVVIYLVVNRIEKQYGKQVDLKLENDNAGS